MKNNKLPHIIMARQGDEVGSFDDTIIQQYSEYFKVDRSFKKLFSNTGVITEKIADFAEELDILIRRKNDIVRQDFWDALWEINAKVLKARTIDEYRELTVLQDSIKEKDIEIAELKATIEKINDVLFD